MNNMSNQTTSHLRLLPHKMLTTKEDGIAFPFPMTRGEVKRNVFWRSPDGKLTAPPLPESGKLLGCPYSRRHCLGALDRSRSEQINTVMATQSFRIR